LRLLRAEIRLTADFTLPISTVPIPLADPILPGLIHS